MSATSCISGILLLIITGVIAGFLYFKYPAWDSKKKDSNGHPNKPRHEKWFYAWIIGLAVLGGTWAFFLPIVINSGFGKDDDGASLRQALIYTTGGVLGVITLGENHRKNTLEKTKNDQDHTRQVHAERRSRYTKAIEHLFNENISVRLGGVYALAGLADEWLTDEKTLPIEKERHKEGQVIINTLCSYIRSSFNLASKTEDLSQNKTPEDYEGGDQQFVKDRAKLREEQELRLAILEAIKNRLNDGIIIQEDGTKKLLKGLWSDFNYDFSNAIFFYSAIFNNSLFGASSNFFGTEFAEYANFSEAEFTEYANFSEAEFTEYANFSEAEFTKNANFSEAEFIGDADFSRATFTRANFSWVKFIQDADFSRATFTRANFSWVKFIQDADFSRATFTRANFLRAKFTKFADFSRTIFIRNANFFGANFTRTNFLRAIFIRNANFFRTTFIRKANFFRTTFTRTSFSGAKFTGNANFSGAKFTEEANFSGAKFSHKVNPKGYNFNFSSNSQQITPEDPQPEYNGINFTIPEGTTLFDPDEPPEQDDNDDN